MFQFFFECLHFVWDHCVFENACLSKQWLSTSVNVRQLETCMLDRSAEKLEPLNTNKIGMDNYPTHLQIS